MLESGDLVSDGGEHVERVGELGFVADGAMAGDDDGGGGSGGEVALGGADHAVDIAAGGVVDEGIGAVEPGVAGMEDVGIGEMDGDVGVGVGGVVMLEVEGFAVGLEGVLVGEEDGGQGVGREGWEGGIEEDDGLRSAKAEAGLLVGDDGGAGGVNPGIAVGVVVVPVGVDEALDGVGADGEEGLGDLRARGGDAGIDEDLALGAGEHGDVAAGAHEDADVAAKLLGGDLGGGGAFAGLDDHLGLLGLLGKEGAWGEVSCGGGCGGGGEKAAARDRLGVHHFLGRCSNRWYRWGGQEF